MAPIDKTNKENNIHVLLVLTHILDNILKSYLDKGMQQSDTMPI